MLALPAKEGLRLCAHFGGIPTGQSAEVSLRFPDLVGALRVFIIENRVRCSPCAMAESLVSYYVILTKSHVSVLSYFGRNRCMLEVCTEAYRKAFQTAVLAGCEVMVS